MSRSDTNQALPGVFELPDEQVPCVAPAGSLLSEAALAVGVVLNVACGGTGACGGCAVDLLEGQFEDAAGARVAGVSVAAATVPPVTAGATGMGETPMVHTGGTPVLHRRVLACQVRLLAGPWRVRVPRHSLVEADEKVVVDFHHAPAVALRPAVSKCHLKLSPPTLADARGDLERLIDALRQHGYDDAQPILCSLSIARQIALTAWGYEVTATLAADQGAWHVIRVEPGDTASRLFGAAVDIGTTTVVAALVDLRTGKIVDAASSYNQQVMRCDDVASRISYARRQGGLAELRELVVGATINRLLGLLARRHGLAAEDVSHMTVAGNTVMTHLFCGLSPEGIGGVPFAPISNFPGPYRAGALGVAINGDGFVDVFPSAAAYVGGDITADLYMCGLAQRDEVTALIDIGTNAEIVIGNRDRSIACAAPAGPAFEGHGMGCGMRAAAGAIDSVAFDSLAQPPRYTVIGGGKPTGVCGSGLIDFVAQAFRVGVLTSAGRLSDQAIAGCPRVRRVRRGQAELLAYEIVPADQTDDALAPILLTERDIADLLQAKGVIFSALQIAMKHFGRSFGEVERFYLAGGFARHIDLDNAVRIGLLPDIDRGRYVFIGNGSLGGAYLALLDADVRSRLGHLAAAPRTIELNLDPEFMDAYTMALFLPNADPSLFPSVS